MDDLFVRLIQAAHRTIESHAVELDALDEAIGDGDHGSNLARGLAAVAARSSEFQRQPLGAALQQVGTILAKETGGAGGTFYGALFRGMGEAAPATQPSVGDLSQMLKAGIAVVQAEGQAVKGDKTLLDVLLPVSQSLQMLVAEGRSDQLGARMVAAAGHGLHATTHMEAKRGLAADLGVASVNRLDPGACSCALVIGAVVGVLEDGGTAASA
jgi:dihydroxyacetone kinase-like protein